MMVMLAIAKRCPNHEGGAKGSRSPDGAPSWSEDFIVAGLGVAASLITMLTTPDRSQISKHMSKDPVLPGP